MSNRRWHAYGWLLLNTLLWGIAFVVVKPSLDVTTPFRYLWYRYALAIICSLPILGYYLPRVKNWRSVLMTVGSLEVLGTTIALGLLYSGLSFTTSIEATLLTSILPVFITLGGIWLLKERQTKREWLGLSLACAGAIWLALGAKPLQLSASSLIGNFLILGYNVVNLFYFPLAKKHYRPHPKWLVTTLSFYLGFITFGLLSLLEAPHFSPEVLWSSVVTDLSHPSVWIAAGYMAIFGSIIGLTAYIKGQDTIEASEASWFSYLQPLVALPAAVFFLQEEFSWWQLGGLGAVLVGVSIAEWKSRRKKAH